MAENEMFTTEFILRKNVRQRLNFGCLVDQISRSYMYIFRTSLKLTTWWLSSTEASMIVLSVA